ncbi:MAG TPA: ACP phosphodiesterase [Gammaproteobacteria bacterium]|nr:ACP phosphodiesterase [Gammaproteobacteria bacterium]
MNHLAHLLLSEPDPDAVVGNLMGDFLRGPVEQLESPALRRGVRLHRRIDSYADAHPVMRRSRRRLPSPYRRYAPILLDVFYDHLLTRHWDRYVSVPLREFSARVYLLLERRRHLMPERMQRYVWYMREYDTLYGYRRRAGIERALSGLSRRMRRSNPLSESAGELFRLYRDLEGDFLEFFPQLQAFVTGVTGTPPRQFGRVVLMTGP